MQLLRSYKHTAQSLDMDRETLKRLIDKDPTFPRPIKMGDTRQAPVFFDAAEVQAWVERKKNQVIAKSFGVIEGAKA